MMNKYKKYVFILPLAFILTMNSCCGKCKCPNCTKVKQTLPHDIVKDSIQKVPKKVKDPNEDIATETIDALEMHRQYEMATQGYFSY